jgi:hypothetical protein
MASALNVAAVMVRSTGDSGCTIQELAGLVWNKCTTIFKSARACCSYAMWYDCKWLECSRPMAMAVPASPAARAVRAACFAEQMEQKKQLLPAFSQKSYPPQFFIHSCGRARDRVVGRCVRSMQWPLRVSSRSVSSRQRPCD